MNRKEWKKFHKKMTPRRLDRLRTQLSKGQPLQKSNPNAKTRRETK